MAMAAAAAMGEADAGSAEAAKVLRILTPLVKFRACRDNVTVATGAMEVRGGCGSLLGESWAEGAHAHLGMTVPGFPNMFIMYGPNTNTSGGSIIWYEEVQAAYVRQALQQLRLRDAGAIEVRADVEAASDRDVQARFTGTAWTQCDSWYRDESGRIVANWPGYMRDYLQQTERLDPSEFRFTPCPQPNGAGSGKGAVAAVAGAGTPQAP